ncbi:MAG: hypothetical protein BWK79_19030 [Beggiatoa sp. IS2]|nr:MAG: hypothetical protein BWK79_19030 [Beggiatoa sp. IS2]
MTKKMLIALGLLLSSTLLISCSSDEEERVSFKQEIYPLLQKYCVSCHIPPEGQGFKKSGLSMESYKKLMDGTQHGPIIIQGESINSSLNRMVEGRVDPSIKMPHGDKQLTKEEIALLKRWVDQGAKNN